MVDFTGGTWRSLIDGSEVSAIADDLIWQVVSEDFQDPWPDQIADANLDVDGLEETTVDDRTVISGDSGDGDFAVEQSIGDVPELENRETWGIAITVRTSELGHIFGSTDSGDSEFFLRTDRVDDKALFGLEGDSGGERLFEHSDVDITTGDFHAIICNKTANDNMDIWVDDMLDEDEQSVQELESDYNPDNHNRQHPLTFYARDNGSGPQDNVTADIRIIEFKDNPYSESERLEFVDGRGEV